MKKVCQAIMKTFSSHKNYLLTNKITNKQKGILFNLKCQKVRGIREYFSQMYFGDIQCWLCNSERDSQCHIMLCPVSMRYSSWEQNSLVFRHLWNPRGSSQCYQCALFLVGDNGLIAAS